MGVFVSPWESLLERCLEPELELRKDKKSWAFEEEGDSLGGKIEIGTSDIRV